jgi:hypothetical protein
MAFRYREKTTMKAIYSSLMIGCLAAVCIGFAMFGGLGWKVPFCFVAYSGAGGLIIGLIVGLWWEVGLSLLGGIAGWLIGVLLSWNIDAVLPVIPCCGFIVGLIAGPLILVAMRHWKRK